MSQKSQIIIVVLPFSISQVLIRNIFIFFLQQLQNKEHKSNARRGIDLEQVRQNTQSSNQVNITKMPIDLHYELESGLLQTYNKVLISWSLTLKCREIHLELWPLYLFTMAPSSWNIYAGPLLSPLLRLILGYPHNWVWKMVTFLKLNVWLKIFSIFKIRKNWTWTKIMKSLIQNIKTLL